MSKYEYTIMMADEVIDTRKSNREYQYAIACLRGPMWRKGRIKELERGIVRVTAELLKPTCTESQKTEYNRILIESGKRIVEIEGWKDDWYVVGYCGNMALATKAHAKESKFIGDCGWDRVVIQPVLKREIKKRV